MSIRNVARATSNQVRVSSRSLNITPFQQISTQNLIAMAHALLGGMKVHIPDRLTAIALLLASGAVRWSLLRLA